MQSWNYKIWSWSGGINNCTFNTDNFARYELRFARNDVQITRYKSKIVTMWELLKI